MRGDGPAAECVGFLQLGRELPDRDAVLQHPDTTPVPREPAVVSALVGAWVETGTSDRTPVGRVLRSVRRLPDEFPLLALRDIPAVKPRLVSLSAVPQWIARARTRGLFLAA